ncbi:MULTISPECIES: sensor histidine kinase [Bacteroidota]|jgi:two-component sensor histidine kinase|uniref:Histidine kinase n=2 Tax=Flectobacillus TaxID=101 RepID=A0ABT6Z3H6_9BACT|nr:MULTISPECIES: histidine kinase [Bacteroidota]MDI9866046.1 histidine kinase [Flectobacillus longus]MDI9875199.1 histidine kinase [Flectobacillus rivi]NBB27482.1 sensor histidine kinase [Cellulophaga sp. BC115SP]
MPRIKLYWTLQIVGWLAWLANEALIYVNSFGWSIDWFISADLNIAFAIFLTHNFRKVIKKYGWVEMPIRQVVPRILGSVVLMSMMMASINIPLDGYILREREHADFWSIFFFIQFSFSFMKPLMIWTLFYYASHYFERKSEIEVEKVRLESSIRETESKVLRAQMNPHFMFNALNSIRALILEEPEKAQKAVTQLSNILRSSLLADRRKTVSLSEELRTVEDYLALEKIRYEDRLQIRKNVYPETLTCQIPPMLLQTLVENAIKHGVSKPVKGGFVSIETKMVDSKVVIEISNTGVLETTESGGFGLENTAHRLELLFGADAKFKIYQASKDVVTAEITVPIPSQVVENKDNPFAKITHIVRG